MAKASLPYDAAARPLRLRAKHDRPSFAPGQSRRPAVLDEVSCASNRPLDSLLSMPNEATDWKCIEGFAGTVFLALFSETCE